MTSKLNLIKIQLIDFDFGKHLKILRVFADDSAALVQAAKTITVPLTVGYCPGHSMSGDLPWYWLRKSLSRCVDSNGYQRTNKSEDSDRIDTTVHWQKPKVPIEESGPSGMNR